MFQCLRNSMYLIYLTFLNNFAAETFQLHSKLPILLKTINSFINNLKYVAHINLFR